MNKMITIGGLMFGSLLVACGGGTSTPKTSGLTESELLVDLTAAQGVQLCDWAEEVAGPQRTVDCPAVGSAAAYQDTVGVGSGAACEFTAAQLGTSCTATVANAEACVNAVEGMTPCHEDLNTIAAACAPLSGCGSGSGSN